MNRRNLPYSRLLREGRHDGVPTADEVDRDIRNVQDVRHYARIVFAGF